MTKSARGARPNPAEHMGLVVRVLQHLNVRARSQNWDDLHGAGLLALCEAAASFDPNAGAAFSTWAWRRVEGAIKDELTKLNRAPIPTDGVSDTLAVDPDPNPEDAAADAEVQAMIDAELSKAPDDERAMAASLVRFGRVTAAARKSAGLSPATCRRRAQEARAYLQQALYTVTGDQAHCPVASPASLHTPSQPAPVARGASAGARVPRTRRTP